MLTDKEIEYYQKKATELHEQGYNCAQSVACALAHKVDVSEDDIFKLMEAFGGGMGNFSETCGAISGGIALIGMQKSAGREVRNSKGKSYKVARELVRRFQELNGSTLCCELKGLTSPDRKPLRSCEGCVNDAVALTCQLLEEEHQTQNATNDSRKA